MKQHHRHVAVRPILSAMGGLLLIALCGCGGASSQVARIVTVTTPVRQPLGVRLSSRAADTVRSVADAGSPFLRRMATIDEHGLSVELAQSGAADRAALGRAVQRYLVQLRRYGAGAYLAVGNRRTTIGALDTKLYDELEAGTSAEPCDARDAARLGGTHKPPHRAPL
jgi:hypothetical protein